MTVCELFVNQLKWIKKWYFWYV